MARTAFPIPFDPERSPSARAMLERRIIEIPDVSALERDAVSPAAKEFTRSLQATGVRSIAFVPLLHTDEGIGTIVVGHPEPGFRLSQKQRALVQTFADQAVIAIENARLFEAEQTSKRELQESLEYQTAMSEILSVISRSPSDLRPVLEAIVDVAARLCEAEYAHVRLLQDGLFRFAASTRRDAEYLRIQLENPIRPGRDSLTGRAALERRTIHVWDAQQDTELTFGKRAGMSARALLAVPLVRQDEAIGIIALIRDEPRPYTPKQIALVETFADQAVIAIENTRLFEAEQASKREVQEALEYQMVTSDVLSVISRSTTDVQPVFDAIVKSAAKQFDPCIVDLCSLEDAQLVYRATASVRYEAKIETAKSLFPLSFDPKRNVLSRAILEKRIVEIPHAAAPDMPEPMRKTQQAFGNFRSLTLVPLIREDKGIGVISLAYPEPGFKLSDKQLTLVQTFASQAVIAIENTRLLNELRESLQQQTATPKS
jgi:GAF domain-containing protein